MRRLMLRLVAAAALASPAAAAGDQGYGPGASVPSGHLPPPGQCRVWYPGRAPGQQPPPTDCSRAQYEAARYGGRVIHGGGNIGRYEDDRRWRPDRRDYRDRRDDDDRWVRVCVSRDWHGHCLRTELRRR